MSATVSLHPATIAAINDEMARYQAREERILFELSEAHKTIGYLVACMKEAAGYCMLPHNCQAQALERGIRRVYPDWRPRKVANNG